MAPGDMLEVRETSRSLEDWHYEARMVIHTRKIRCLTYSSHLA